MTTHDDYDGPLPPADPAEFPKQLKDALRRMSARGDGPVVDLGTGAVVAEDGRLVTDPDPQSSATSWAEQDEALVACMECARAVAMGWWGAIARHIGEAGEPVCVLCGEGQAVLTAAQWFARAAVLVKQRTADGQRRSWRDDAAIGLGAARPF